MQFSSDGVLNIKVVGRGPTRSTLGEVGVYAVLLAYVVAYFVAGLLA